VNEFIFAVFPYIALTLFFVVPIIRRKRSGFAFTTRASGFIERPSMGIAALCIHWGLITLFCAHLLGFIGGLATNMEIIDWFQYLGLVGGVVAIYGFTLALLRRILIPEMRAVSQVDDYVVLVLLLTILVAGIWPVIVDKSFGLSMTVAPWAKSIWTLSPEWQGMATLPLLSKIHITAVMVLGAYFPFTKLVHMWTIPFSYFTRPYQSMRTYRRVVS
jgi:nitrate reductase gamma subunit